jgi:N-methylhydantoinase A
MPLVAAGGAGPIHAGAIAAELQIPVFIVPRYSAAFCAAGMLFTNLRHDFVQTSCMLLAHADFASLATAGRQLQERSAALLDFEGIPPSAVDFLYALDMRYRGQHHDVTVNLAPDWLINGNAAAIAQRFHQVHDELYGYSVPAAELELINLRLTAIGGTVKPVLQGEDWAGEDGEHARKAERSVWIPAMQCFAAIGVYDGTRLRCGNQIAGPALVELPTTTILIPPDYHAVVDPRGSFVVATSQALGPVKTRLFSMAASARVN